MSSADTLISELEDGFKVRNYYYSKKKKKRKQTNEYSYIVILENCIRVRDCL